MAKIIIDLPEEFISFVEVSVYAEFAPSSVFGESIERCFPLFGIVPGDLVNLHFEK